MIREYLHPGSSKNYLVTIVIGTSYLEDWEQYSLPLWKDYCMLHSLGILAITDNLIEEDDPLWKKANWQKLLIGISIKKLGINAINICYLDSDILINPYSPNIFHNFNNAKIGLVSKRKNLPYPYEEVIRRIAFFRNNFYDNSYPLDSALNISIESLYKFHSLKPQNDEACTGVIIFNVKNHSKIMKNIFYKYDSSLSSITNGGEQTHVNFEFQNLNIVQWFDYRFQALWLYEMAWNYSFLYEDLNHEEDLIASCVESSLISNYFLHFAGLWHESKMWKSKTIVDKIRNNNKFKGLYDYMKKPVYGTPRGIIKP